MVDSDNVETSDKLKNRKNDINKKKDSNDPRLQDSINRDKNDLKISPKTTTNANNDQKRQMKSEDKKRNKLRKIVKRESKRILQVIIPICLCMTIVVIVIHFLPIFSNGIEELATNAGMGFYEKRDSGAGKKIGSAIIVVLIFIVILAVVTFCMAIIIIYKWKRFMNCFFVMAFVVYLGFLFTIILSLTVYEYNIAIDWITVIFFVWNYTALGEVVFFVGGPKLVQQIYLIVIASNVALLLILVIPNWTAWLLLVALCLWDLYVVLHETGPLNRIFQSGANDLPPILYATAIWLQTNASDEEGGDGHYEIGLGDFVFYSILVGKSFSSGDFFTAVICFVSILVGLAITMFILMLTNKPLPALPISVMLGVLANFMTNWFIVPFNDSLTEKLIFI